MDASEWHTIRPGKPPLSLTVREITSVSVTFILSSNFSNFTLDTEPFLASLGLAAEDENEEGEDDDETDESVAEQKKSSVISEVLAKGLSVNVNSATWKGVYIRIDDKTDEAVIIIYGLMPGKKYDIDLGLVQGGQNNNIRRQVVTDDEIPQAALLPEDDDATAESPMPTPSTSPNGNLSSTPPNSTPRPQLTLEDRLNQLQHTLSVITTERDTLTSSFKVARRDAQKADAALRSEMEILKRASEKHSVAEHRARQKVLALQEAAKRAQISTQEMEEMVLEVEAELPGLKVQRSQKEQAYSKVKEDADRARKDREREEDKERRKLELMRGELAGLNNKMERLNGKKEKLETSIIPDFEEQLRAIELEIERIEADPLEYTYSEEYAEAAEEPHAQWNRQTVPTVLTRPSPVPIQRPGITPSSSSSGSTQWAAARHQSQPTPATAAATSAPQSQHQRSSSSRPSRSPVTSFAQPQRHSSLKSTSTSTDSTSSNSSPTGTPATANTSTLSSRAPPFEPGRMRTGSNGALYNGNNGGSVSHPNLSGTQPVPILWSRGTNANPSGHGSHKWS
ncbi:hypothetical protein FB45DRAFT_865065 [Roridomyces roridus]|uniref:Uncharacterized protein n=1 Tax=Roridomyces roridus TaxID=1738132 RepID=A0AAD7C2L5_9AGAR|nr:hypothetical protein FB45DRAFT_865065 [Roridomyces roridus]